VVQSEGRRSRRSINSSTSNIGLVFALLDSINMIQKQKMIKASIGSRGHARKTLENGISTNIIISYHVLVRR
jgi:hypothetical protein